MRKLILFLSLAASILVLKAQPAGYTPVTDLAKFKQQFTAVAQQTQSIKSDFTQEKNVSMLSEKIMSQGKFWFKKNNLLRMEYNKPFEYLIILNKDNMYIKDGKNENKVSVRGSKTFQQINKIIVDCVQGTVFNSPDFATKVYEAKGAYLVELSPTAKALKEFFNSIDVIIEKKDYSVSSIDMKESSGDNTVIHFTNRALNTPLADALFAIK
jgi:outer membrane lipoprotein-sorting protein